MLEEYTPQIPSINGEEPSMDIRVGLEIDATLDIFYNRLRVLLVLLCKFARSYQ